MIALEKQDPNFYAFKHIQATTAFASQAAVALENARLFDETQRLAVDRDPGPPYGKAYGYWGKHRKNRRYVWRLTDGEIRDLVAVRMIHEYYGMPVEAAMDIRASGKNLTLLMAEEYGKRHGKGHRKQMRKGHGKRKR